MRCAELVVALFAGCVIGWWWGERPDVLRGFSWLSAMTAFGTVGAVIAALWSARTAHSREDARVAREATRRENEAKIIALQTFYSLSAAAGYAKTASKLLLPAQKSETVTRQEAEGARRRTRHALDLLNEMESRHLLAYLPDQCGERIAFGYGQLTFLSHVLEEELREPSADFDPYWENGAMAALIASEAEAFLSTASSQIQSFALQLNMELH